MYTCAYAHAYMRCIHADTHTHIQPHTHSHACAHTHIQHRPIQTDLQLLFAGGFDYMTASTDVLVVGVTLGYMVHRGVTNRAAAWPG